MLLLIPGLAFGVAHLWRQLAADRFSECDPLPVVIANIVSDLNLVDLLPVIELRFPAELVPIHRRRLNDPLACRRLRR